MPSHITQFNAPFEVPIPVVLDFILPKKGIGFGQSKVFAVMMSVPEASIDENCSPVFFEDNIGRTG